LILDDIASFKNLKNYYQNEFDYQAALANEKRLKDQGRKILINLRALNPKGKSLLDIGSGFGFFLEEAKSAGLTAIGIEPSLKLAAATKQKKLAVVNQTFEAYFHQRSNKKFDYITMINVLEHISDPFNWLRMASSLLNKNGILYLETPNLNSFLYRAEKDGYTFLTPPDHRWIFSLTALVNLVRNISSLKVVKVSTYSYPEHLVGIVRKIIRNMSNHTNPQTFCHPTPRTKGSKSLFCHPELVSGSHFRMLKSSLVSLFQQMKNNKIDIRKLKCIGYNHLDTEKINGVFSQTVNKGVDNKPNLSKKLKYLLFDKIIAPFITPILNLNNNGSILSLYLQFYPS